MTSLVVAGEYRHGFFQLQLDRKGPQLLFCRLGIGRLGRDELFVQVGISR